VIGRGRHRLAEIVGHLEFQIGQVAPHVVELPLGMRGAGGECEQGAGGKAQAQPTMTE